MGHHKKTNHFFLDQNFVRFFLIFIFWGKIIGQKSLKKGETEDTPHLYIPPRGVGGCLENIKIFGDFWVVFKDFLKYWIFKDFLKIFQYVCLKLFVFLTKIAFGTFKILKFFACGAILPHYISPIGPNNYVLVAVLYEVKNLYKFYLL